MNGPCAFNKPLCYMWLRFISQCDEAGVPCVAAATDVGIRVEGAEFGISYWWLDEGMQSLFYTPRKYMIFSLNKLYTVQGFGPRI